MILVTGAGGKTGVAVLKALVARGAVVRALVRNSSHRAALNAIGVHDIVAGEMEDPRAWSQAAAGTNAVYYICPNHRARNTGMDDYQRETLTKMFQAYARDGLEGNPNVLGWLLKRPPTSLAAFATRMAATHA